MYTIIRAEKDVSSGLVPQFLRFTAFLLVPGIYYLVGVNSYLWLYFLPLGLVAGPWFFPVLSLIGVFVIVLAQWLPGTLTEAFVCGQAAVVVILLACGALVRTPAPGSVRAWLLSKTGDATRLLFIVTAAFLVLRWGMFRWVSTITSIGWAVTLLVFAWKAPWPAPQTRTTWKGAMANAALLLVSTIAGLAMLEFAARAMFDDPNVRPPGDGLNEHHGKALFMPHPNHADRYISYNLDSTKREFDIRISSQGLRERELGPKEDDEFRILALGDSFTMGWGVSYEEAYPHVLEVLLNDAQPNKKITVINGGVTGYGPWQEGIFLQERGWRLEPDLVLLQLYPENDIGNTLTRAGRRLPAYNREWEERISYWRHVDDWRVQIEWRLLAYSRLYYTFTVFFDTEIDFERLFRNLRFFGPARREAVKPPVARPFYVEIMLSDWYPELYQGWMMLREDVLEIQSQCQARNVPFVAFTVPTIQDCIDHFWTEATVGASPGYTYDRYKDVRVAEAFFGEARLKNIDVPSAIVGHENPSALYLMDGHFSPAGNRVVAERLARALLSDILPEHGVHPSESPSK